jgi:hypothetical protein
MTTTKFTSPAPQIERDFWGRPLVVPTTGGKAVPYTRCTTYVGCIEDTWNLSRWTQRMVVLGLSERADLQDAIRRAERRDSKTLNELCEAAKEAGGGNDSAAVGTYMHAVTEAADRGEDPAAVPFPVLAQPQHGPEGRPWPADFDGFRADLDAYLRATAELKAVHIEDFTVLDKLKIGGTPDRVVRYQGKRYIADLKTGDIEWGSLKIAAQLAVYARSSLYDPSTGERSAHGAELDKGIVIHAPAGTGTCRLFWVDLVAGWNAVLVARKVREQRTVKFPALMRAVVEGEPAPTPQTVQTDLGLVNTETGEVNDPTTLADQRPSLRDQIAACTTADQVRALWQANATVWTPELTELAKFHIASL